MSEMDEQVLRAMAKWPDVPAVYGWLRLGRRGQWFLVDRGRPDFDESRDGQGSQITSPPILDFLGRNFGCNELGAWFWQNGPQRVFVDLDLAPLVLRVLNEASDQRFVTQTGHLIERIDSVAADADGNLLIVTERGPALIDDRDIGQLDLDSAEDGRLTMGLPCHPSAHRDDRRWEVRMLQIAGAEALGQHFGFLPRPQPTASQVVSSTSATSNLKQS